MNNELVLRILVNMKNQQEADNAFRFIHYHWWFNSNQEDYDSTDSYHKLVKLLNLLDNPDETRIMKFLNNSEVFE